MFNVTHPMKKSTNKSFKQEKCRNFLRKIWVYFSEFSKNTSLHGIKYIGDDERSIFERSLWTILILISIITCICLLSDTYLKWCSSPIVLLKDKEPETIGSIPFPSVTICPENKINQSVFNFTESFRLINTFKDDVKYEICEKYDISTLLCDDFIGHRFSITYNNTNMIEKLDTRTFIDSISSDINSLTLCKFGSKEFGCNEEMMKIFTEEGVCYTFNGLNREFLYENDVKPFKDFFNNNFSITNWAFETGYDTNEQIYAYPQRVFSSGMTSGLTIYLAINKEFIDYGCRNLPDAFKIILSHPSELPRTEKLTRLPTTNVMVEIGTDVMIGITPNVMSSTEVVKKYKPHIRGCFYQYEKKLRYFKDYSEQKCEFECIQNYTLAKCGCLAYYMPVVDDNITICRSNQIECFQNAKEIIAVTGSNKHCNCLPTCNSITYSAEVSEYTYDLFRRFQHLNGNTSGFEGLDISRVTIYFKESQYFMTKRNELYGFTEFISNCGGLFGLFVGFSIISLIETIYFITIRIIVNCAKYGKEKWYGNLKLNQPDLEEKESEEEIKPC